MKSTDRNHRLMAKIPDNAARGLIRLVGAIQVLVGVVAAFYGPLEIYVFYFFSPGGQFHYEGFGVGSFWFGLLVLQNLVYYLVALLLLPAGIGNLQLRRWALIFNRFLAWLWLLAGGYLVVMFLALIPGLSRQLPDRSSSIILILGVGLLIFLLFLALPGFLIRLLHTDRMVSIFEERHPHAPWVEKYPISFWILVFFILLSQLALHLAYFFKAIFPLFGELVFGRPSAYLLSMSILALAFILAGLVARQKWAWWGAVVYFTFFLISGFLSFFGLRFGRLLEMLVLPPYEMEIFGGVTLIQDLHLVWLVAYPLLVILVLLIQLRGFYIPPPSPGTVPSEYDS